MVLTILGWYSAIMMALIILFFVGGGSSDVEKSLGLVLFSPMLVYIVSTLL